MANHTFSSLMDILKDNPPPKPKFTPSLIPKTNTTKPTKLPHENPYVTEMFGELYFKESPSSTLHSLFPSSSSTSTSPSPSPSPNSSPDRNLNGVSKHKEEKRNGKCMYFQKSATRGGKLFPPPISHLKMFKTGTPFVYFNFDEKKGVFVREEIKILPQGNMRASRENGRLRLSCAHDDEEEDDDEDFEEEGEEEEEKET